MGVYREDGLAAGWEPSTTADDTIVRRFLLNWAAMLRDVVQAMGGTVLDRDGLLAADVGRPSAWLNLALLLEPLDGALSGAAAAAELFEGPGATGMAALFSPWPTPDLRPLGWALGGHPPFMYRPPGGAAPPPPVGCEVRPVRDERDLADFARVLRLGYPLPGVGEDPDEVFPPAVLSLDGLRLFVVRADDRALAVSAAYVAEGMNGVTLVATLPEARGRGFGGAATWAAILAEPDLPAGLLASDPGRPLYERMGYWPVLRFTFWHRERPAEA